MTNNNKFKYNLETFTKEDAISYYLLGVFITDGNVSEQKSSKPNKKYYSCELKSADHTWIKKIASLCGENLLLTPAKNSKCLRLRLHNTFIGQWLINHNCIPNKTLCVKFPHIPTNYLADFIRGCWDGDGSISLVRKSNNYIEARAQLYSASKNFIYSLQYELQTKFAIKSYIYKVKMGEHLQSDGTVIVAKNQLYQMVITGKNCQLFVRNIYYQGHKMSLDRKNEKAQIIIAHYN